MIKADGACFLRTNLRDRENGVLIGTVFLGAHIFSVVLLWALFAIPLWMLSENMRRENLRSMVKRATIVTGFLVVAHVGLTLNFILRSNEEEMNMDSYTAKWQGPITALIESTCVLLTPVDWADFLAWPFFLVGCMEPYGQRKSRKAQRPPASPEDSESIFVAVELPRNVSGRTKCSLVGAATAEMFAKISNFETPTPSNPHQSVSIGTPHFEENRPRVCASAPPLLRLRTGPDLLTVNRRFTTASGVSDGTLSAATVHPLPGGQQFQLPKTSDGAVL